jgi:hypothetical protein
MSATRKLPMLCRLTGKFVKRAVPARGGNPPEPPEDGEA